MEKQYEAFVVGDGIYRLNVITGEMVYINQNNIPLVTIILSDGTTSFDTEK